MANRERLVLLAVLVASAAIGTALALLAASVQLRREWIVAALCVVGAGLSYRAIPKQRRWDPREHPTMAERLWGGLLLLFGLIFTVTMLTIFQSPR